MSDSIFKLILEKICPIFMIAFGLIANFFIILIFLRKPFRSSTSNNYLLVLAIFDVFSILTLFPYSETTNGVKFVHINEFTCKLFTFLAYFFPANSSWLLAFISIERLFSIKYSKKKVFASIFSGSLILFAIGLYYYYFFYYLQFKKF